MTDKEKIAKQGSNHKENHGSSCCHAHCSCHSKNNSHEDLHDHDEQVSKSIWLDPETIYLIIGGVFLAGAIITEYLNVFDIFYVSIFALISAAFTGIPIVYNAIKGLILDRNSVCELAGLAIIGAIYLGEYLVAAEVGFILTLGEIAEEYGYSKTRRDIEKVASHHPKFGLIKHASSNSRESLESSQNNESAKTIDNPTNMPEDGSIEEFVETPIDEINVGDVARIRPGDIVCADGVIVLGETTVDESCLTGESIPIKKAIGDIVYSGSVNLNGLIEVKIQKRGEDSTYSKIVNLIKEAESRRPPTYPFIEKFLSIYTPLTLIFVALVWLISGDLEKAITVIIVACPCALLLAAPSATIAAIGAGARRGILVKDGIYLEEAGRADSVLFDKTGTLTTGKMSIEKTLLFNNTTRDQLLQTAAIAESGMQHPLSLAIMETVKKEGIVYTSPKNLIQTLLPNGVNAEFKESSKSDEKILVGNKKFALANGITITQSEDSAYEEFLSLGLSTVFVIKNNEILGLIGLSDTLREESAGVIEKLRKVGIKKICILSGDKSEIAVRIAKKCNIATENVFSEILPQDKKSITEKFQQQGSHVCFVGDGVNDSPALAQANIGVAMASRENTAAIETSHAVILKDSLTAVFTLIRLGRVTLRTIKANVIFAIGVTSALIILALIGIIQPVAGAIGHQIAVIGVLLNSAMLWAWIEK